MKLINFSGQGKEKPISAHGSPAPQAKEPYTSFLQTCSDKVVIARKTVHKGMMQGHISNGDGIVSLSDNFSLRFVASDMFVEIELIASGSQQKHQTWRKAKAIKTKKPTAPEVKQQGQVEL